MDKTPLSLCLQLDSHLHDKFNIHKRIASGSFGSVFLATNLETSRRSALKLEALKDNV